MTEIRLAARGDEASLLELVQAFPTLTPISASDYSQMLCQKLSDPSSFVAVATSGTKLVGYVSGYRHSAFYAAGESAWVDEILVLDSARRTGIGRLLMKAFEAWAKDSGCKLTSLATAGAADFYGKLGYTTKAGYFKKYVSQ